MAMRQADKALRLIALQNAADKVREAALVARTCPRETLEDAVTEGAKWLIWSVGFVRASLESLGEDEDWNSDPDDWD